MRTSKTILTGLTVSLALSGVAAFAGTTEPRRTVEDRVRHELLGVPYINVFDNLSYSVNEGVVTLSGQVTQPIEKYNAEQAVKHVEGVTRVDNRIEVLPLSPFDDRIRLATLRALVRSAPLDKYFLGTQPAIRIVVKNGNVTLDGVVLNPADRQFAYMAANGVPGVFSVTNNLRTER
jgi:hyperosmotically inducible protein